MYRYIYIYIYVHTPTFVAHNKTVILPIQTLSRWIYSNSLKMSQWELSQQYWGHKNMSYQAVTSKHYIYICIYIYINQETIGNTCFHSRSKRLFHVFCAMSMYSHIFFLGTCVPPMFQLICLHHFSRCISTLCRVPRSKPSFLDTLCTWM